MCAGRALCRQRSARAVPSGAAEIAVARSPGVRCAALAQAAATRAAGLTRGSGMAVSAFRRQAGHRQRGQKDHRPRRLPDVDAGGVRASWNAGHARSHLAANGGSADPIDPAGLKVRTGAPGVISGDALRSGARAARRVGTPAEPAGLTGSLRWRPDAARDLRPGPFCTGGFPRSQFRQKAFARFSPFR